MERTAQRVVGGELVTTIERLVRLVREVSTAGDLSSTAASVLAELARRGPSHITGMAQRAGVSQPAMSQLVSRLDREGLVVRAVDGEDRRGVLVEITDAGRAVIAARRSQRAAILDDALGRLDEVDVALIATALPALDRLVDTVLES